MSRQSVTDGRAIAADQHRTDQPIGGRGHQLVDRGAFEQPARDPHHPRERADRRVRGVRVGGLRIVDIGDAVRGRDHLGAVPADLEARQRGGKKKEGDVIDAEFEETN